VDRDQRKAGYRHFMAVTSRRRRPVQRVCRLQRVILRCILRYISRVNVVHGLSPVQKMFPHQTEATLDRCGPVTEPVSTRSLSNGRRVGVCAFLYDYRTTSGRRARSTNPRSISGYHVIDMIPGNMVMALWRLASSFRLIDSSLLSRTLRSRTTACT